MEEIISNLKKVFIEDGADESEIIFKSSTESEMKQLRDLVGDKVERVLEFYKDYQPTCTPMFPCYFTLLGIDSMIDENTCGEPGMHLAKYGVVTIGVTVGGNVVCIDTNNVNNGDPKVLLFDSNFCYYDDEKDIVRIGYIPSSAEQFFDFSDPTKINVLNDENIKICGHVLSESFVDFLEKLSCNYYEDIEAFLD